MPPAAPAAMPLTPIAAPSRSTRVNRCAGVDPTAIVKKYSGRVKTTHIKNRPAKASGKKPFVGEDNFDWKAYVTACYENGTEWLTLEQEEYPDGKSSLECTKISFDGLKNVLKELGK